MENQKLVPFLSFTGNAEEAMRFYAGVLPGAEITSVAYFGKGERYGDEGKVLTGVLTFAGQQIMFLDMQPAYPAPAFSWSASFLVNCGDEAEFDALFSALSQDGAVMMGPEAAGKFRKCAWVTDKFGVTWQPVWE
jgi:predicted 3-demethylubiquinone-9 3-methyltransferase (glyoxalase superfamily)